MSDTVQRIILNNLQYNPNRDPQVYRRLANENFRIQAVLGGSGSAKVNLSVDGNAVAEESVDLPGKFSCETSFDSAGIRIATLTVEANGETVSQDIRLDVLDHAWIG